MITRKPRIRYWMSKRYYSQYGIVLHWQMVYYECRGIGETVREAQKGAGVCTLPGMI